MHEHRNRNMEQVDLYQVEGMSTVEHDTNVDLELHSDGLLSCSIRTWGTLAW